VDWAYAVIERMDPDTLATKLIPFNLGAAVLNGDDSQNMVLMAGDVVTIFSKADMKVPQSQQTKFVLVEGEVNAAGTYSVAPGETLRQIIAQAGGLGPNAYLYGATFTRESAREEQQQRLDEYVQQVTRDMERSQAQAAESGNVASTSVASTTANEDEMLAQLRTLRASGRIVLDIKPWDSSVDSIPDIPLEDGDHLVIPPMPASVLVVGEVYNGTSFLYRRGSRAGDFLRHAGGPTRLADSRHTFIIRADGSVVSRTFANGSLSGSFSATPMYPGDSIIVPEKLIKPSIVQSLAVYGSIFSSLALTAAAIAVVK
jgi:protein involved in polysaccharide export with SLBB domain